MKIAYIMSRFPHLPETFILREMNELDKMGWQIALYPLIFQQQAVVHPEAQPWLQRAHHAPYISWPVIQANLYMLLQNPGLYLKIFSRVLGENLFNFNFLFRSILLFPKAVLFARQMKAEGIDHIHAHYASHPALVAWIIHQLTGISYSMTVHAHDIFARTSMLSTKLGGAVFVVAISEYNREHIAHIVGAWVKAKTHVIHCGIVPENYTPIQHFTDFTAPLRIICVGSLKPIKGQIYLVEACRLLKERGIPFRCQIIGNGPEFPEIQQRVIAYQLAEQVELMGDRNEAEVAAALPGANCYVQPSIGEGIPVAVMEALAAELPVVATAYSGVFTQIQPEDAGYPVCPAEAQRLRAGLSKIYRDFKDAGSIANLMARQLSSRAGIHELVIPGKSGYLVAPADPSALAEALIQIYQDPENAARMALAGKEIVLQDFDLRKNVQKIAALFQELEQVPSKLKKPMP